VVNIAKVKQQQRKGILSGIVNRKGILSGIVDSKKRIREDLVKAAREYEDAFDSERKAFLAFDKISENSRTQGTIKYAKLHTDWIEASKRLDIAYSTLLNMTGLAKRSLKE
jgi:hypothetical protein